MKKFLSLLLTSLLLSFTFPTLASDTENFDLGVNVSLASSSLSSSGSDTEYFDLGVEVTLTPTNIAYFDLAVNVTLVNVNISITPDVWNVGGNPSTGSYVTKSFTVTNNGNTAVKVKIAVNDSQNWTYTNWSTYSNNNLLDYFTCRFSFDNATWNAIEVKTDGNPTTVLTDSLQPNDSVSFYLQLWIPKKLSTTATQTFEVWVKAYQI